jgi:hypothetical protein
MHVGLSLSFVAAAAACSGSGEASVEPTEPTAVETPPPTTSTPAPSSTASEAPTEPTGAPSLETTGLPPSDDMRMEVPAVEGFSYGPRPDAPVPWDELALPDGATGVAFAVREAGAPIGTVVVVDDLSHNRYLDQLFDRPAEVERDRTNTSTETLIVTNTTRYRWQMLAGVPAVVATFPEADHGRWVWQHDGLTWLAVGTLAMERWATGVASIQQPAARDTTYDYGLVGGTLYHALPLVQPYVYLDAPVADVVASQTQTFADGCGRRLYSGTVVGMDEVATWTPGPGDLILYAATIAGSCRDDGWFEEFDANLRQLGFVDDVVGDTAVRRRDGGLVIVDGDDVFELVSDEPATLDEMAPFINAFVTGDLPPDVTDDWTLPIGTCLYRAPSPDGNEANRHTFAVDCAAPHQGEVFHRFDVAAPADGGFPGDEEASRLADEGCTAAFAAYVGMPLQDSRLGFVYVYPSADTWAAGDRTVMCIVHGDQEEEMFRTSLAGAQQ